MKKIKDKRGFSLIELLIALVILYLCLPSFFNFLCSTIFNVKFSSNFSNAIILCEDKVEELMSKSFNSDDLKDTLTSNDSNLNINIEKNQVINNFSSYAANNFDHYEIKEINNTKFYIIWNVADTQNINSYAKYKIVVVIVYWIGEGKGHKVTMEILRRNI